MRIGEIDLPDQLLDAQSEGKLVIFAGAGVSVAPPSNYPQLRELAEKIARNSKTKLHEDEPLDRFLGRLADQNVDIYEKLRVLLTNPLSRPTSLHVNLLKLFPEARSVRLVTTNFDSHFSTAARKLFPEPVESYFAPALPLGYDVGGIVYLHGNIEKDPSRIVLTDGDFGRAYLTEGWARRFLQELFTTYTVLFVGYSHNDPVMNYLARGLPPEAHRGSGGGAVRRYALAPGENQSHWEFLGIEPVTYPLVDGRNPHRALAASVAQWAGISRMRDEEHDRRIRKLLREMPPEEGEAADYVARALRDPRGRRVFTGSARGAEWMEWADRQGLFDPLWETGEVDEAAAEVARWFVEKEVARDPRRALDFLRRHGGTLNPVLWATMVDRFASRKKSEVDSADLARWIAVLLHPAQQGKSPEKLLPLLASCRMPGDEVSALLLFEYLTRPHLSLEEGTDDGLGRKEIRLEGDAAGLKKAWKELFVPRLDRVAHRLAPIIAAHLVEARLLLEAAGGHARERPSAGLAFLIAAERQLRRAGGFKQDGQDC